MVSDLKLLLITSVKSPRQNNFFSSDFFKLFTLFKPLFAPFPEVQCPNFLNFQNHWGKVMERSGPRFENFCFKRVQNHCAKKHTFNGLCLTSRIFLAMGGDPVVVLCVGGASFIFGPGVFNLVVQFPLDADLDLAAVNNVSLDWGPFACQPDFLGSAWWLQSRGCSPCP